MLDVESVIIVFLIFLLVLAIAFRVYDAVVLAPLIAVLYSKPDNANNENTYQGSAESKNFEVTEVLKTTQKHIDEFPAIDPLKITIIIDQIPYSVDLTSKKLAVMKPAQRNTAIAKIILDTILHYQFYVINPNTISRTAIEENLKKIASQKGIIFDISALQAACKTALMKYKANEKHITIRDYIRQSLIVVAEPKTTPTIPQTTQLQSAGFQSRTSNIGESSTNMKFAEYVDEQTDHDAIMTAKSYDAKPVLVNYVTYTPYEFDKLNVINHPAGLYKSLESTYSEQKDRDSVKYAMSHVVSPVAILQRTSYGDSTSNVVLDGAHRIVAAYLTSTPIRCAIYADIEQMRNTIDRQKNEVKRLENIDSECHRERRILQDKVYELKADIERLRLSTLNTSPVETASLRQQVADLTARNHRLEEQLRAEMNKIQSMAVTTSIETEYLKTISKLSNELADCQETLKNVLEEV